MVHALEQIHRTLKPGGPLIDLRPLASRWPVEVCSLKFHLTAGNLTDLPFAYEIDSLANKTVKSFARRNHFSLEIKQTFPIYFYWDDPQEMRAYVLEKWSDSMTIDDSTYANVQRIFSDSRPESHVRIKIKMGLWRWKKTGP